MMVDTRERDGSRTHLDPEGAEAFFRRRPPGARNARDFSVAEWGASKNAPLDYNMCLVDDAHGGVRRAARTGSLGQGRVQHQLGLLNAELAKRLAWSFRQSGLTPLRLQMDRGEECALDVGASSAPPTSISSLTQHHESNAPVHQKQRARPQKEPLSAEKATPTRDGKTKGVNRTVVLKKRRKSRSTQRADEPTPDNNLSGPARYNSDASPPKHTIELRKIAPFYNTEANAIRTNVPCVRIMHMLREMYDRDLAEQLFPRWVACDFDQMRAPGFYRDEDHRYVWNPLGLDDTRAQSGNWSIYCTLVNRIDYLQTLQDRFFETHRALALQLVLWQDTHHMLALHIEHAYVSATDQALRSVIKRLPRGSRCGLDHALECMCAAALVVRGLDCAAAPLAEKVRARLVDNGTLNGTPHVFDASLWNVVDEEIGRPGTTDAARAEAWLTEDAPGAFFPRLNKAVAAAFDACSDPVLCLPHDGPARCDGASLEEMFAEVRAAIDAAEPDQPPRMPDLDRMRPAGASVYDVLRPSLRLIMHEGELPDLSFMLDQFGFFQDTQTESYELLDSDLVALLALLRKTTPHPHRGRMLFSLCAISMVQHPRIWKCINRMLFCSLAGLYERGSTVASFFVRHELYRHFLYEPGPPGELCSWMHGFQYTEFREDYIKRHLVKRNGQRCVSSRRSVGLGNKNVNIRCRWTRRSDTVRILNGTDVTEMNPPCFVGANEVQARAGYCNMTDFMRLVFCEYINLLLRMQPASEAIMRRVYWFDETFGTFQHGIDLCRNIVNALFEPPVPRCEQPPGAVIGIQPTESYVYAGRELLRKLAELYVPCLKWEYIDGVLETTQFPRNALFQRQIMAPGFVAKITWNARVMALLEAVGYDTKKRVLHLSPRIMKESLVPRILYEMVRRDVNLSNATEPSERRDFCAMQEAQRAMSDFDREFIERMVEYCFGRMHYGAFETWDDALAERMRPIDRWLRDFMQSCHLDAGLEQFSVCANASAIPVRTDGDMRDIYYPSYMALVPLFGLKMHPFYVLWLSEYHYTHEIEQKSVLRVLDLMRDYPREYVYIRWFFQCISRCTNVRSYALPRAVAEMQKRTWAHAFNVPPSESADRVRYCRYHGLKKPLVEENASAQFHHGDINVTLDPSTMKTYCRAPNPLLKKRSLQGGSRGPKQRRVFDFYTNVWKTIMCARTPLQTQHMFGAVLQINKDLYVMCPMCCAYTYLSKEKFCTPFGFACSECAKIVRRRWDEAFISSFKFICNGCTHLRPFNASEVHRHVVWDDTCRIRPYPFWRIVYFCNTHNHAIFGRHHQFLSLHIIQTHLARMLQRNYVVQDDKKTFTYFTHRQDPCPWGTVNRGNKLQNACKRM